MRIESGKPICLAVAFVFLIMGAGTVAATDIIVIPGYSIQGAVNTADDGDTVIVFPGTYTENVDVSQANITIRSESGNPDDTIVQANVASDHVFNVTADNVTISALTVKDATTGIGIKTGWIEGYDDVYYEGSDRCIITNNTISNNGLGIGLGVSSSHELNNNVISQNGNGISLEWASGELIGNIVSNNGNGILLEGASGELIGNIVSDNGGGGIDIGPQTSGTLINNIVSNNGGNGISVYVMSSCEITDSIISNNVGNGIYMSDSRSCSVINTTISSNGGSGIVIFDLSSAQLFNSTIKSNDEFGIDLDFECSVTAYNNYFNNTENVNLHEDAIGRWNTTKTAGTNIAGGPYLGGNYWLTPDGTGFSQTNDTDADRDGICDENYTIASGHIDYLPLTAPPPTITIIVNASGSANYTTIQAAVTAANPGDTIEVYPGTYNENVDVDKSLIIISQSGNPDDTNVQANNSNDHVFNVTRDNVTISGFNVTGATGWDRVGIFLDGVQNNTISNNNLSNNDNGIKLWDSNNNTLINNNASNSYYEGIQLYSSCNNNTLTSNTASNNTYGIRLYFSCNNNTLTSNTASNNTYGIYLSTSSNNNTLINNNASNNDNGIYLSSSSHNNLASNTANSNDASGIYLSGSNNNNTLTSNTASDNDNGIWLGWSSNGNNLTSNTANSNNDNGICLWSSSNNNTLTNNTASDNYNGIWLSYSGNNNTLSDNTVSNNDNGIYLLDSSNNTLTSNTASNNSNYGIRLSSYSNNNLIYNNHFNNSANTYFSGINTDNVWNTTNSSGPNIVGGLYLGGNSWAHPNGTGFSQTCDDANWDGFCDLEYNIDVDNTDYLPLIIDNLTPMISITSPADGSSTKTSPITVSGLVNGTGSLPVVTVNDVVAETTIINFSGTFTATVPLVMGTNTIYANVTDGAGNANTTSVTVTRTSPPSDGNGGNGGSGGGGGGGATGEAFENILVKDAATSNVVAGELSKYEFSEEKCHIVYIQFRGVANAGQISTLIEILKDTSTLVDSPAPGVVYQNMNIWVGNAAFGDDKIEDAVIGFRVSKECLSENSIEASSIALYRYGDGKWNQLSTFNLDEDGEYIYFEAETPGFSPFAIVGFAEEDESVSIQDSTPPPEEDIPVVEDGDAQPEQPTEGLSGFNIVIGVLVTIILVYIGYLASKGGK